MSDPRGTNAGFLAAGIASALLVAAAGCGQSAAPAPKADLGGQLIASQQAAKDSSGAAKRPIELNAFTVGDYFAADLKTRADVVKPIYETIGDSLARSLQAALDKRDPAKMEDQQVALKATQGLASGFDVHKMANLILSYQRRPATPLKDVIQDYFNTEIAAQVTAARAARGAAMATPAAK